MHTHTYTNIHTFIHEHIYIQIYRNSKSLFFAPFFSFLQTFLEQLIHISQFSPQTNSLGLKGLNIYSMSSGDMCNVQEVHVHHL